MINRLVLFALPALLLMLCGNCAVTQHGLPSNTLFVNSGTVGWSASGPANLKGNIRTGEACAMSWGFYFQFAFGDASIRKAAAKAGITKIYSVSHKLTFGHFYQDWCTVVTGE